jgi:hypothetical protein
MTSQKPVKLEDLDGMVLTAKSRFRSMEKFLSKYCEQTNGMGAVRTLVGDVEIENDGSSTDPAALSDWQECVSAVLAEDDTAGLPEV